MIALWLAVGCAEDPPDRVAHAAPEADAGPDRFVHVGEEVPFDARGDAIWTFGDGTTAAGAHVLHVYDAPGHYTAFVQVTAADGRTASDGAAVTVTWPVLEVAPRVSSALATDADGALLAVLPDFDVVAVVDPADGAVIHWPTCAGPRSLSVGDGTVAVACPEDDRVDLLAPDGSRRARVTLPWGSRPFGVVVAPGGEVRATLQGRGQLARIVDDVLVEQQALGPDPRGLAWVDGVWLASRFRSPDAGGQWWVDGVQHVLAPDPGPDSDTNTRGVPTYLQRIAVRPDGRVAVHAGLKANVGRGLVRDGLPLTHETTVRATVREVGTDGADRASARLDDRDLASALAYHPRGDWLYVAFHGSGGVDILDAYTLDRVGALPAVGQGLDGIAVSADGATLWVLASLTRELVGLDLDEEREIARIDLRGDLGEVLEPDVLRGQQIFAGASDPRMTFSGYLSCASCHLDGGQDGRVWDFTDRGEGLRNTIALHGRAGTGHGPLHWSANFDEVQDFENDIRGAMAGTGFLSDADWAQAADTLGAPKAGISADLDALAAYLETLDTLPRSPHRRPDGALAPGAAAGEAVFVAAGCPACHPPPTFTDSSWVGPGDPLLHDVGTLTSASGGRLGGPLPGIDTPTLRGLHATAPYLHDGSAATVRDVLTVFNPDDAHGSTSGLAESDIDALALWLLSLE